ncbi:MAG: cytochrome b/b6 domain-containing protein [Chloroflexota bacterium]|nr:cytochrome b/b6 domain-containing protein [Chloroflexota bacterium]
MTIDVKSKAKSSSALEAFVGPRPAPGEEVLPRYSRQIRWLHWVTAVTWIILFITGLFFTVPQFGGGAVGGVSGLFHRIAAVVVCGWAGVYFLRNPKDTIEGILFAFKWGPGDIKWAMAAPAYYFFGKEDKMPPQEHMNTGQKLWWLVVLGMGAVMVITGALMWFFKELISPGVFLWAGMFHSIGMAVLFAFAFVHVYLSVIHPKMKGIFWSMVDGTVSARYAESHHKKWYDEIKKG